jgi:monovalent cation/proton antiporter MnhG/PhaG subunit
MTWVVMMLLAIGILGFVLTSLGLLLTHDVFDQIQFLAPASLVGVVAIATAVLLQEGFNQAGVKAMVIAVLFFWANPILSHATARAARVRHRGQWQVTEDENLRVDHEGE